MKTCDECGATIGDGEAREKNGRVLCEDCYVDLLSSPRTCDPWAVYSAKSLSNPAADITEQQAAILEYLEKTGGATPDDIAKHLNIKPSDLEREFAALRHMEKVRGQLVDGKKIICLW